MPTTVLAQQHYLTALQRFFGFGEHRRTEPLPDRRAQTTRLLADLASGKCDLVIGTHKLLRKDVKFKDLGLLVVDESSASA